MRQFPRFLFSNPQNTKNTGPYIVHTLFPKAILKVQPNGIVIPLDVWDECSEIDLYKMINAATSWHYYTKNEDKEK